jgi:hypothetical protein
VLLIDQPVVVELLVQEVFLEVVVLHWVEVVLSHCLIFFLTVPCQLFQDVAVACYLAAVACYLAAAACYRAATACYLAATACYLAATAY